MSPDSGVEGWYNITAGSLPSGRFTPGFAYDGADGYGVLFGGEFLMNRYTFSVGYFDDTWSFANGVWTNITTTAGPAPSPRANFGMTYDPAAGAVLLFGGAGPQGEALNDTWEFSGGRWAELSPSTRPPGLTGPAMTYDPAIGAVLLVGGQTGTALNNQTWEFRNGDWSQVSSARTPPPSLYEAIAYDASTAAVVLYGGFNITAYSNTTWEFSRGNWTQLNLSSGPPPLASAEMVPYGSGVVMNGGSSNGREIAETWEFADGSWTNITSAGDPPPLESGVMIFDSSYGAPVLFGGASTGGHGFSNTWTLDPTLRALAPLPSNGSLDAGQSIVLQAEVPGAVPPVGFQWYAGPQANCGADAPLPAANGSSLLVQPSEDTYYCYRVTDALPVAQSLLSPAAFVTVDASLVAGAVGPAAVHLDHGQSINVSAGASGGVGPYQFQWYLGDSPMCADDPILPGATGSTLSLPAALNPGAYFACYRVTDSSTVGPVSVLSAPASVIVAPALGPARAPTTSAARIQGEPLAISGTLPTTGTAPYAWQWLLSRNGSDFLSADSVCAGGSGSSGYGAEIVSCSIPAGALVPGNYTFALRVRDSASIAEISTSNNSTPVQILAVAPPVPPAPPSPSSPLAPSTPGGVTMAQYWVLVGLVALVAALEVVLIWTTRGATRQSGKVGPQSGAGSPGTGEHRSPEPPPPDPR